MENGTILKKSKALRPALQQLALCKMARSSHDRPIFRPVRHDGMHQSMARRSVPSFVKELRKPTQACATQTSHWVLVTSERHCALVAPSRPAPRGLSDPIRPQNFIYF